MLKTLTNKRIVLVVCGSISAYKSPDIVRRLQDLGAEVRVILTAGGAKFITELCLQSISKNPVLCDLWDKNAELAMGHIELAKWADAIIVAPASADTIADLANGKADDLATSVVLASDCPLLIAPSMNQKMYQSKAVKANLATLKKRQICLISPIFGEQACGDLGVGNLAKSSDIADEVAKVFLTTKLTGKNVLITLGATLEALDPVRFLSNRSSGKMGMELANAAVEAGAKVTIICGKISIEKIDKVECFEVISAAEMHQKVMQNIKGQDIFIACAAVADYRVKNPETHKTKRLGGDLTLELIKNKDILADVCRLKNRPLCIGFAAETRNFIKNAEKKLKNKGCDAIIVNDVSGTDFGVEVEQNEVVFLTAKSKLKIAKNHKQKIARKIIETIIKNFYAK